MASVPSTTLSVALYKPSVPENIAENESEDILGWITKNSTNNIPCVVRVYPQFQEATMAAFPNQVKFISTSSKRGAVKGTALISTSHKLLRLPDSKRPRYLYRVTHGGQPHKGRKSRLGRGSDPLFFQRHLKKHLIWKCREPSPFLSSTDSLDKALRIAAWYEVRNYPDVRITRFRTSGPGWDHEVQRLWGARDLIRQFGMHKDDRRYFDNEYLVEDSIPEESIVDNINWKEARSKFNSKLRPHESCYISNAIHKMNVQEMNNKRRKAAAERRKDGCPPKERKMGKRVMVGPKLGSNTGA
ncbi:hypothetical protein LZ31DRAFT_594191 [Colletotrichum somersetense]|nr:hypothetical protein LZ31DRAFT_594191 [Colletotrichum somersetense]